MARLDRILNAIDLISVWTGKTISWAALAMMATIVYDVVARYFFMSPTIWAEETGRFLLTGYFLLGGAYTMYFKGHVRMDVLYTRLSPRGKAILDALTSSMFFFSMLALIWFGGEMAWKSLKFMERTESVWAPPTFLIKVTVPLSCTIMLLEGLAQLIRDIRTIATGKEITGTIS